MKNRDTFDRISCTIVRLLTLGEISLLRCPVLSLVALRSLKILPRSNEGGYPLIRELFRNFRVIIADSDTARPR